MSRKIPPDELVIEAAEKVMKKNRVVESLRQFSDMVNKELAKKDDEYRVGARRLRYIAVTNGITSLEIRWKKTKKKKAIVKCPVCGEHLKVVKNETVFGGTVTLGFRCPRCPFKTGIKKRVPQRYIFVRRY